MQIVITGVAGYIGSHIANYFLNKDYEVLGIDNLSTGKKKFVDSRVKFFQGDVQNHEKLNEMFSFVKDPENCGVIHCAGIKYAGESVKHPLNFYENNTAATLDLLKAMDRYGLGKFVFSSSCSIYGNSENNSPISELTSPAPISPYGRSKLMAENIISDYASSGKIKAVSLRYFNVAGNAEITAYDLSAFNIFPNLYRSIIANTPFEVYGNDYGTPDGTCIRDYVDVRSLSKGHFDAFVDLNNNENYFEAYNFGSGKGFSVGELISKTKGLIDKDFQIKYLERRSGDPETIWADITKANTLLGWENTYSCEEMLMSGWDAWKRNNP